MSTPRKKRVRHAQIEKESVTDLMHREVTETIFQKAQVDETTLNTLLVEAVDELQKMLKAEKTEFFAHQGEIKDQAVVADHASRLRAISTVIDKVSKLRGLHPSQTKAANQGGGNITINFPPIYAKEFLEKEQMKVVNVTPNLS